MDRIDTPLPDAQAWADYFSTHIARLPILKQSQRSILHFIDESSEVNLVEIAKVVLGDPFLTLRTLALTQLQRPEPIRDLTTVSRALMMKGIESFFKEVKESSLIESQLSDQPIALRWLLTRIARARKAAHFAHDWSTLRRDLEHQEVTIAALLYEINEMLLWLFAPRLMLLLISLRQRFPNHPVEVIQQKVFNTTDQELREVLISRLNLPLILKELMNPYNQTSYRTQIVLLAVRFSRHLSQGWQHPAIPSDIEAIESVIRITRTALLKRLNAPYDVWIKCGVEPPKSETTHSET